LLLSVDARVAERANRRPRAGLAESLLGRQRLGIVDENKSISERRVIVKKRDKYTNFAANSLAKTRLY
jgi:hypothetical protein